MGRFEERARWAPCQRRPAPGGRPNLWVMLDGGEWIALHIFESSVGWDRNFEADMAPTGGQMRVESPPRLRPRLGGEAGSGAVCSVIIATTAVHKHRRGILAAASNEKSRRHLGQAEPLPAWEHSVRCAVHAGPSRRQVQPRSRPVIVVSSPSHLQSSSSSSTAKGALRGLPPGARPAVAAPMQSPFATLPDAIVADLIFAHLPAAELVETVPRVSRQFRRCASLPSAAWRDFEVCWCTWTPRQCSRRCHD